jgi:nitrate reductase delta subunit
MNVKQNIVAEKPEDDYESALQRWFPAPAKPSPAGPEAEDALFGGGRAKSAAQADALERVREWVRDRFKLRPEDAIMVSEVTCTIPGCPPLETAVAFWDEAGTRYHFKVLKPVAEVTLDNLPFAWMKDTLVLPEGFGCECC